MGLQFLIEKSNGGLYLAFLLEMLFTYFSLFLREMRIRELKK
ncbi:Uncharacterised protein [Mycobacteroides abscessus subsp. abscessus]|nr:Uncharacterised protein [Mycobacteroides abscessus subsp. abscessus]